jgi:hypothetical protein
MVRRIEPWQVRWGQTSEHEVRRVPDEPPYDVIVDETHFHRSVICERPGAGYEVELRGALVARHYWGQGRIWRDPYHFDINEVVLRPIDGDGWSVLPKVGLGSLHRRLVRELRDMSMADPHLFAEPRSMPTPGAAGHSLRFYAEWVRWYLDAVAEHGQRYMAALLAVHPGYSAAGVRRIISRAGQLGLITGRARGRAGGAMTDQCRSLLEEEDRDGQH